MTIWVPEYLSKNKTESSNNQTLYIDLPKNEQISFLQVEVSVQGAASVRTTTTLIDEISKYEVLADGQSILYSLEPEIAAYVDFVTHGGVLPPMSFNYTPNARETHEFIIPFGRHPFDEEYLLDTSHYKSVQLQVPYDVSNARWTSGTFRHNIVMWRPLDRLSPKGFIRSRVHKKETSNTAVETIEHKLPMRYPLRYVGCRFEDFDQNIATDCTAIKVNIDEGRLILADLNINEWRDLDKKRYPQINDYEIVAGFTNDTDIKFHVDTPWPKAIVNSGVRGIMARIAACAGEYGQIYQYDEDNAALGTTNTFVVHVEGPNPHKCLTLIDGRKEPFNAPAYTEGKIEYTLAEYEMILHTFVQEVVSGRLT